MEHARGEMAYLLCTYNIYGGLIEQFVLEWRHMHTRRKGYPMSDNILKAIIPAPLHAFRLDAALPTLWPDYSRVQHQNWIKAGLVTVDGQIILKGREKVIEGQHIALTANLPEHEEWEGEDIPLDIIFEDAHIIVINKPAGLVVHPGAGNPKGTLMNALVFHDASLKKLPRAGIVHRLDKDTTGLMVIAKTSKAFQSLIEQLQERSMKREYEAIVKGDMVSGGTIEEPIGRHAKNRTMMAVSPNGKEAVTHYRIAKRFPYHTLLDVSLESGRTHQIRVHLTHLRYPLVGDPVYGRRLIPSIKDAHIREAANNFPRQALHAKKLTLTHPESGERQSFEAKCPDDMALLIQQLSASKDTL